jgi:hypothetical protein
METRMKTVMNNRFAHLVMGLTLSIPLLAQIPTYNISTLLGSYSQTDTSVAAPLLNPLAVAVDGSGNVYFTDTYGNRVRRIDAVSGATTTVAGDGTFGVAGQNLGGPAVKAKLWQPAGLVFDSGGNLYIADSGVGGEPSPHQEPAAPCHR